MTYNYIQIYITIKILKWFVVEVEEKPINFLASTFLLYMPKGCSCYFDTRCEILSVVIRHVT